MESGEGKDPGVFVISGTENAKLRHTGKRAAEKSLLWGSDLVTVHEIFDVCFGAWFPAIVALLNQNASSETPVLRPKPAP